MRTCIGAGAILLCLTFSSVCLAGEREALEDGRLGMEAYQFGQYEIALWFLNAAINEASPDLPERGLWLDTKAHILWETGEDYALLDFSEFHLPAAVHERWWCHVLERRGHAEQASACWYRLNEPERARRALRTQALLDAFTPAWTIYGYRPAPD